MPQTLMTGTRGKIYKSTMVDNQKLAADGQIGVKFLSLGVTISNTIVVISTVHTDYRLS